MWLDDASPNADQKRILDVGDDDDRDKKALPPTLGSVLLICAWRYFALPAISIAIVYGTRKHLPIKAFIHDPVFVSAQSNDRDVHRS